MEEYEQAKKQLQFFCNQELQIQQVANRLAERSDPSQHNTWLSCINQQRDCFNQHEQIIESAVWSTFELLPSRLTPKLFMIRYNHSQYIINNQKQFKLI
jgi:hypothetical protein